MRDNVTNDGIAEFNSWSLKGTVIVLFTNNVHSVFSEAARLHCSIMKQSRCETSRPTSICVFLVNSQMNWSPDCR